MSDLRSDHPGNIRAAGDAQAAAHGLPEGVSRPEYLTVSKILRTEVGRRNLWEDAKDQSPAEVLCHVKAILLTRMAVVLGAEKRARKVLQPPSPKELRAIEDRATELVLENGIDVDKAVELVLSVRRAASMSAISYLTEIRRGTSALDKLAKSLIQVAQVEERINVGKMPSEIKIVFASETLHGDGPPTLLDWFNPAGPPN